MMWKRKKNHWEFYYEDRKVGFVVVDRYESRVNSNTAIFKSYANGRCIYTGEGLNHAKCVVENEF